MPKCLVFRAGALACATLLVGACSNPDRDKLQHFERGNQYVAEHRDAFAVVEYSRAVQIDPQYGDAHLELARTYERMNNMRAAIPQYVRAADALPDNRDLQLKAGQVLLLSGRFDDARGRATMLLARDANDVDALLLHANALAALRDPEGAVTQIEEALEVNPESSDAFLTMGAVRMQRGQSSEAEAAFRRAITLAPTRVDPRLALVNFLWSSGRLPEAETVLHEALAVDPRHLLANRMLGVLYVSTGRVNEAEAPLKAAADASDAPAAQLQLADYYAGTGRADRAIELLTPLSSAPSTFADAEVRLAAIDYAAGRTDRAHERLDAVLARVPHKSGLLVTKAQWLMDEGRLDEALERARAAVAADPESAPAQFVLATVHDRRGEVAEASRTYTEVLRLNPRAVAAQVGLSRLSLASGDGPAAVRYAERARMAAPSNLDARVALARSLLAAGHLTRAEAEVDALLAAAPDAAAVHTVHGTLLAKRHNAAAARAAFERARQLAAGDVDALGGLTFLDIQTKNAAVAVARLEAEVAKQPANAALLALLARAHRANGNEDGAEQALRRAVAADPRFNTGYAMLADLYTRQGRVDEALAEFQGIVARDSSAIGARTMIGILLDSKGRREEAVKAYEATVSAHADAAIAANNLAFIYAERGENLGMALQLATTAKQRLPEDPSVDDTLGWIYYKQGQPGRAVPYLQASLKNQPDAPDVLYHLGMAYAGAGDTARARETLTRALSLDPAVGGDEARRTLGALPAP